MGGAIADKLTLMRGAVPVTSFLGALGGSLRETRITAMLGYLIAQDPANWEDFFSLKKPVSSVTIEADYDRDRADILLETSVERIIVEAKVSWVDPKTQAKKYNANRKYFFTNYALGESSSKIHYVAWKQVAHFLETLAVNTRKPYIRHLAKETILYMKEHQLIRTRDSVEIYARELNDEVTLNTFLKCHIYGCWLEKGGGTISRALYFAPHFGKWIASITPGIFSGISYVAKIEAVEVTDTWASFVAAAKRQRGNRWLKKHRGILKELHNAWGWNDRTERNIAFLETPRLVFNPPINKDLLQKGKGFLSRRTFAFDELFDAWSRSGSVKIK